MDINSRLSQYSDNQKRVIAKLILHWCKINLGEPPGKRIKLVLDFKDISYKYYADFEEDEDEGILTVYMRSNLTFKSLIRSILHEMSHALETWGEYDRIYRKVGYKNHPHEIRARRTERLNLQKCWADIKLKIEMI